MLYIFDKTEKLINMLPSDSFFDAVHREVLNGENTFRFTVPADTDTVYVEEGNYVGFKDLDSYWQIFEVKRIVDLHGDGLTRTAYCEHIFYELLDDIVTDKRPSADATSALDGMLQGTRWQVGAVDDLGASKCNAYYESALSAVQKVANAWQGELRWRIIVSNNQITERRVDLLAMRGTDTGKQFAYAKDILGIEREVDTSSIATALYGRGKGVELNEGSYGRRLTFADIEDAGKPLGQEWVGDDEALARWGRNGRHRFDVFIDEDETDPVKLLEKTRAELARRKEPRVTYRLDVVSLEELSGYEHEAVRLGDLVRVIDREFKPELVVSARVIELERDLLATENTKVVLGSFAPTIVEATINIQRQVSEMASKPYNTKWLDGVIDVLQNAIENTQSYVFQTAEEGILILDAPDYEQATQAMKLGGGMFAIANQKDSNGGWNWRTFGTGSGFTADEITTGKLKAELIEIGPQTTFAPGYDPSLIEGASAVGMGVDSDCLGLWHFDGSLNSHKGVAAIGDANFDTGCFGQAVKIEEGTTNLLLNPLFTLDSNSDGIADHWFLNGVASDIDCFLIESSMWGGKAQKAVLNKTTYGYSSFGFYQLSINKPGAVVTFQVAGRTNKSRVNLQAYDVTNATITSSVNIEVTPNVDFDVNFSFTIPSNCTNMRVGVFIPRGVSWTINDNIMLFAAQLEQKPYATPFVEGTRLGVLKAPTTGLSASQGTINFRTKNLSASANGSVLVDLPNISAGISDEGNIFISNLIAEQSLASAVGASKGASLGELGQTFTTTGALNKFTVQVYIGVNGVPQYPLIGRIYNTSGGLPIGSAIATSTITHTETGWASFEFNVPLAAGTMYAFTWQPEQEEIENIYDAYGDGGGNTYNDGSWIFWRAANSEWASSDWDASFRVLSDKSYGPNKSTLTAWDSISLAWKSDRLSLVVNDEEVCYIDNPGLPASLGSHVFIGTDRNGNNAINTLVDELRIDKVYRDAATRTAWHKMGVPFYTSEDMKQWPGYMKLDTDGLKVYDSQDQLRVLLGSWLDSAVRKYGLKVVGGEIYSSLISTGEEDDNRGTIKISHYSNPNYPGVNWGSIDFYGGSGKKIMSLDTGAQQPALRFYDESIESQISASFIGLGTGSSTKELYVSGWDRGILISSANESITMGATSGNSSQRGIALTGIRNNLYPQTDGGGNLGLVDRRWWTGYIVYTQTGDLAFSEKTCAICDGKFEDGDILALLTKTILDNGYTFTIPVHEKCKNIQKELEVEVPEMVTKYKMNDRGELEEYNDVYFEEIEEEIITVHPDYELDEDTGRFKRKMNDWNLELFDEKEILAGVMASERVAKVRDNVITKKPKLKKIQIKVGQNKEEAGIEN